MGNEGIISNGCGFNKILPECGCNCTNQSCNDCEESVTPTPTSTETPTPTSTSTPTSTLVPPTPTPTSTSTPTSTLVPPTPTPTNTITPTSTSNCECHDGVITDNNAFEYVDCNGLLITGGAELLSEICFDNTKPYSNNITDQGLSEICSCN
jgi:hypothetical protein